MAYTWTELLDDIKVRGMIPTSQSTFTEARLLALTNAVFRARLLPLILSVRENYFSYDVDTTCNATGTYDIPTRAIGGKLENAALIDSTTRCDLVRYSEEEIYDLDEAPDNVPGFYIKRNQLYLLPPTGHGYTTLRLSIFLRPLQIVAQSSCAQITNINTGTKTVTCTTVPSSWTTASTFDLVQQNPHFDALSIDQAAGTVTTGSSGSIIFSSSLSSRLAVGDWVGLAGQTCVVQAPLELHPLLSQLVANECLKNCPDTGAYKIGVEEADRMERAAVSMLSPRVEREGRKVVNRSGILRRGL